MDERACPIVSFDYCFICDQGVVCSHEEFAAAGEGAAKVLVVPGRRSKAVFADVVPSKGVGERGFAIDALFDDIRWLRYSQVTLKSDSEAAVVKLLSESLREFTLQVLENMLEEHSPEYDTQADGSVEVWVELLIGQLRTL